MKKSDIYCLLIGLILFLPSCVRTDEDLFDESAALRLNRVINETKGTLLAAEKGWIMEYFPNEESGGVTFLMKFDENGMAKMATIHEYSPQYTESSAAWDLITDNGPVLTFNTYDENEAGKSIFHIFSDPRLPGEDSSDGKGLGGDYEFMIMKVTADEVTLRGKKHGTAIILKKFKEDIEWEEYFIGLKDLGNLLFSSKVPHLLLKVDEAAYRLSNGLSGVFDFRPYPININDDDISLPFIVTDYGIRFVEPFKAAGQSIQTFKLSEDKNSLVCIDEKVDVEAKIVGPDPTVYFAEDISYKWEISTDLPMGSKFENVYNKIATNCKSVLNETFSDMIFTYYGAQSTYSLSFKSGKYTGHFYFEKVLRDNSVEFIYKGQCDNNGKYYLNNINGFAELLEYINGVYLISTHPGSALNLSRLEFKSQKDSEIRFYVLL